MRKLLSVWLALAVLALSPVAAWADIPTVSATGTLSGSGQTVTLALTGQSSASIQVAAAGSLLAALVFEGSTDGGVTWFGLNGSSLNGGVDRGTTSTANNAPVNYLFTVGGLSNIRVRTNSYTSGSSAVTIIASMALGGVLTMQLFGINGLVPQVNTVNVDGQSSSNALWALGALYGFNGTTWDRFRTATDLGTGRPSTASNSQGPTQPIACDKSAIINLSTAGTTQLVALSGTTTIYVCGYNFVAVGGTIQFIQGTGTNCATSPSNLTGAYPAGTISSGGGLGTVTRTTAGQAWCVTAGTGLTNAQGILTYAQF